MPKLKDITPTLLRKLERLPVPRIQEPYCRCGSGYSAIVVDAADIIAGGTPDAQCPRCGKSVWLVIEVLGADGREQLRQLDGMEESK